MMTARVVEDHDLGNATLHTIDLLTTMLGNHEAVAARIGDIDMTTVRTESRDTSVQRKVLLIQSDLDVVNARAMVRYLARKQGFSLVDQARISTAVSELARNIYAFAETGQLTVMPIERNGRRGIELMIEDRGPGMRTMVQAMQDSRTSTDGKETGLPSARRFMDDFEVQSQLGKGTIIVCRKWCA